MNCRQVREQFESDEAGRTLGEPERQALERHLQKCGACRREFGHRLDFRSPRRLFDEGELKAQHPQKDPQILEPVEFKDLPVRFELHLDDKIEEIKIVEQEVDVPLPEDAELHIIEADSWRKSIVFRFDEVRRLYSLEVRQRASPQDPWRSSTEVFGPEPQPQKRVRDSIYACEIFRRQDLRAWIEMDRGKARIRIRSEPAADISNT